MTQEFNDLAFATFSNLAKAMDFHPNAPAGNLFAFERAGRGSVEWFRDACLDAAKLMDRALEEGIVFGASPYQQCVIAMQEEA